MVTKITFSKCYSFDSPQSRARFEQEKKRWRAYHNRDTFQDFSEKMTINGFVPKMLCELAPELRPVCLSTSCFCFTSCIMCSPVWRWWFGSISVNSKYVIHKRLTC